MTPIAREWVEKAEEDWGVALREQRARPRGAYGAMCFHAQQCAEKYLKAILANAGLGFPKIHDLVKIRDLAAPVLGDLRRLPQRNLARLTRAAVEYRYPGFRADRRLAASSIRTAGKVRGIARRGLGL